MKTIATFSLTVLLAALATAFAPSPDQLGLEEPRMFGVGDRVKFEWDRKGKTWEVVKVYDWRMPAYSITTPTESDEFCASEDQLTLIE